MPDAWETAHGLNPNVADNNGDFDADGYTNLEEYINEIAAWPAMAARAVPGDAEHALRRDHQLDRRPARRRRAGRRQRSRAPAAAYWQPSRYDVAQIRGGTAVVDAVGQHAGTLQIAAAASAGAATLNVVGGWLDVAGRLEIGARSEVNQTGGTLIARRAVVIGGLTAATPSRRRCCASRATLVTAALLKAGAGGDFRIHGRHAAGGPRRLRARRPRRHDRARAGDRPHRPALEPDHRQRRLSRSRWTAPSSDRVSVAGAARLGGALDIRPVAGFAPRPGDRWTILVAAGGIPGAFARVSPGYSVRVAGNRVVVTFDGRPTGRPALLTGITRWRR